MKIVLLADITAGHILPILKIKEKIGELGEVKVFAFDHKITKNLIKDGEFIKPINSVKDYLDDLKVFKSYEKDTIFLSGGGRITLLLLGLYLKGYRNLYSYEFNAVLGKSNKLCFHFLKRIFTYFPYKNKKCKCIGSPLEENYRNNYLNKKLDKVLMLTGSNGSKEMFKLAEGFENSKYSLTVSLGVSDYKFKGKIKTCKFIPQYLYQDYDLIIARSGAGTIADIFSYKVPVVFVPSKNVKNDHQKKNVLSLQKYTKVEYLDYNDQTFERLEKLINSYDDLNKREDLVKSYKNFKHSNVIEELINEIKSSI